MEQCRICTEKYAAALKETLFQYNDLEVPLDTWEMMQVKETYCFVLQLPSGCKKTSIEAIAHIVSNFIQKEVLCDFTKNKLAVYGSLEEEDKRAIAKIFINNNYIAKEDGVSAISYYLIYHPILKYLEKNEAFHVEGWIRFRMKPYLTMLEDMLEQTIDNYEMKKDYLDLLTVLKQRHTGKESLLYEMNLVCGPGSALFLFDEEHKEITAAYEHKYCKELLDDLTITPQDLVLHVLLEVAPTKLVMHRHPASTLQPFLDTVAMLFSEQLVYCEGCELCQVNYTQEHGENLDRK